MNIIQRQLGHANLGTASIYLQGIDPEEIIAPVHMRRAHVGHSRGTCPRWFVRLQAAVLERRATEL